ncbi:phage portal protein [Shouchella lehensis]|uniref:Phage portal protein n=1 Tax=Shouchella lehensis TaxID=300825 RepID=A0A4Y7WEG0_9BACI|nr:phage portal protein [Shouchella lehensis]TES45665.1 phage portal protein [Shouchella lehensis]
MAVRSTIVYNMKNIKPEDAVQHLVEKHSPARQVLMGLHKRWDQENVEILSRQKPEGKANNRLPHDYRGYIISQVIGYLFGNPISYQYDDRREEIDDKKAIDINKELSDFITLNAMDDLDMENAKMSSITGYAGRLAYYNANNSEDDVKIRLINIPSWECLFVQWRGKITHSLRYMVEKDSNGEKITYAELYDETNVTYFRGNNDNHFVLDPEEVSGAHNFDSMPLILFKNNEEERGDFEKVECLIDAYDKMQSDTVNELETFANAYMFFKNMNIDKEFMEKLRQTGGIQGNGDSEAQFITKQINDTFIRNAKQDLKEDIHKFSHSVDMSDEKFSGGSQSGESRKWKLKSLEDKAGIKIRKMSKAFRYQFKVICSAWDIKKKLGANHLDFYWTFKRSVPIDLIYIADYMNKTKGAHSTKTMLEQIPYIDDVQFELDRMEKEATDLYNGRVHLSKTGAAYGESNEGIQLS